jgi:Mn-dependent DtxR family transcriptional regulator
MELLLDAGSHPSSALAHKLNDISTGIEYHREYVGQRCRKLAEYGLLEKEYSHYKLSEKGQQYLDGELDAQQLEATESE